MRFSIYGWSALYATALGIGAITCDNGQSAKVKIEVKNGDLTAGKYRLSGHGTFSKVPDISELFGAYAKVEVHAGEVKSVEAQVVPRAGGINLGIVFWKFRIEPAGKK